MLRNIVIILAIIFICSGCQLFQDAYISEKYGYKFTYPKEWLGDIGFIEYEKHTEFVRINLSNPPELMAYIIAYTQEDWAERRVECCGVVVGESDEYVFTVHSEALDNDLNSYFKTTKRNTAKPQIKVPSYESQLVELEYNSHGFFRPLSEITEDYDFLEAVQNRDVFTANGSLMNVYRFSEFTANVRNGHSDTLRIMSYGIDAGPYFEELFYTGERIEFVQDYTRDPSFKEIRMSHCTDLVEEISDTNPVMGDPLRFGMTKMFYLTGCSGDNEIRVVKMFPLQYVIYQFLGYEYQVVLKMVEPIGIHNESITLEIDNEGLLDVMFIDDYNLLKLEADYGVSFSYTDVVIPPNIGVQHETIIVPAGEAVQYVVDLSRLEAPLEAGKYQLIKTIYLDEYNRVLLSVNFEVE